MCRLSYSELFKSTGQFQFAKLLAFNTQYWSYSYIVYQVKMESGWFQWLKVSLIICTYTTKIFLLKSLYARSRWFLLLDFESWGKKFLPFMCITSETVQSRQLFLEQPHSLKCPWSYLLLPAYRPPNRRLGLITKHWECVTYVLR